MATTTEAGSTSATAKFEPVTEELNWRDMERWLGPTIDMEVFQQLIDLDDDESHSFSVEIIQSYFGHARGIIIDMEKSLSVKDLRNVGNLGYMLKGQSASFGVERVQTFCEHIHNYARGMDANGKPVNMEPALHHIVALLSRVKYELSEAESYLMSWYKKRKVVL